MVDIGDTLNVKPGDRHNPQLARRRREGAMALNSSHHHGERKLFVVLLLDLATERDKE